MATIGSGKDFATVSAWADDLNGDTLSANAMGLVTGLISETVQIYFRGVTLGAFSIILRPDTGQAFTENANKLTNALRWNSSNGAAVSCGAGGVEIDLDVAVVFEDMQFKKTANYNGLIGNPGAGLTASRCIFQNSSTCANFLQVTAPTFNNVVVINTGTISTVMFNPQVGGEANNSIFVNVGTSALGIQSSYGTHTLRNVAVFGHTTDATGTFSGNNNATDAATGGLPATARQNSLVGSTEWENVSSGTEDFRLKSTSVKLKDTGTSTSVPSTDIMGQSRAGSPDIGVWELQGAGGGDTMPPWWYTRGDGGMQNLTGGMTG